MAGKYPAFNLKQRKNKDMTTISKEISAGKSKNGEKEWKGGTLTFNVEGLNNVEYNSAKDHLQYGASTLWRNHGGQPKDGEYGRFVVTDGVFSFNPEFRVGERTSKKAEAIKKAIDAQYELVAEMTGAELTDEQKAKIAETVRNSMA